MIHSGDLKLGNLIETETYNVVTVDSLAHGLINNKSQNAFYKVRITEAWLKKFGFRKLKSSDCETYWFQKICKGIWFVTNDINPKDAKAAYSTKLEFIYISDLGDRKDIHIKYLHDLQNKWRELVGQKLTVK